MANNPNILPALLVGFEDFMDQNLIIQLCRPITVDPES